MANILIINADANLKRLIKLALPGMEHSVQDSATLQTACAQSTSSKLDLVISRFVADDGTSQNVPDRSPDRHSGAARSRTRRREISARRPRTPHRVLFAGTD